MKQTAVELLIEQIKSKADSLPYNTKENRIAKGIYVNCLMMAKQAKEMERIQIIDASATAYEDMFGANGNEYGENYYNKKFNN